MTNIKNLYLITVIVHVTVGNKVKKIKVETSSID